MKRILLIVFALLSVVILTGCDKDEVSEPSAQERILGKWKFISLVTETTKPSQPPQINTEYGAEGSYFDFRTDGNLYYSFEDDEEAQTETYSIENETVLRIGGEACTIKELTSQKLVFELVIVNPTNTRKQTFNLSR
ncbi:lipocalin family protein [Chryseobacterium kwangjuense]|uniref:Lipocalin family protein n=1 Tax=Chryseobacterium kwangjuense TaxID=267125 RepID=A0ABW9JWZ3_9FLAO